MLHDSELQQLVISSSARIHQYHAESTMQKRMQYVHLEMKERLCSIFRYQNWRYKRVLISSKVSYEGNVGRNWWWIVCNQIIWPKNPGRRMLLDLRRGDCRNSLDGDLSPSVEGESGSELTPTLTFRKVLLAVRYFYQLDIFWRWLLCRQKGVLTALRLLPVFFRA